MATTNRQGFVFSLDLLIAFLAVLLMLSLMVSQLELSKEKELAQIEKFAFYRTGLFLSDTLVKNRDGQNALLGSAFFDFEKQRVEQNALDWEFLEKGKGISIGKFFVSRVSLHNGNAALVKEFEKKQEPCISIDRLVFIENSLRKLEVLVCERKGLLPQP